MNWRKYVVNEEFSHLRWGTGNQAGVKSEALLHQTQADQDASSGSFSLFCKFVDASGNRGTTPHDAVKPAVLIILCVFLLYLTQLLANETEGRKYRIRPDFKEDPTFKRLTDYNHTAVHIPTDIYDGCE